MRGASRVVSRERSGCLLSGPKKNRREKRRPAPPIIVCFTSIYAPPRPSAAPALRVRVRIAPGRLSIARELSAGTNIFLEVFDLHRLHVGV